MDQAPRVGLGVLIVKDHKILLGKRMNSHGHCSWSLPGGHLEFGESLEECARREVMEETGLETHPAKFVTITNDIFLEEQKHYVSILMVAQYKNGSLTLKEPDKCERWEWFDWKKLPSPLFLPLHNLVSNGMFPVEQLTASESAQ